ncbi:MAG: GumC family protein, partial [Blastocatellia bacterium]
TSISADRKSGIITVTVTDHNPGRAAAIAGAYVEELDTLMAQLTTSSAHRERVFLESRLNGVTQDLESVEKEFSQFASKNATIDVTEQGKAVVESAAMLDGQLIATESQLEGLRQIYNENNVRVRATKARVNELRSELQKMTGKAGVDSAANGSQPGDAYPSLRQLPILGVRYADLFRHLKVQEAVFETLTKEYELAKVQEAKEIPTVKVLDAPDVPEKKSFPPRALFISLGALCALGLGISWVLGTARWQAIDSQDPRKIFARRVVVALRAEMPWVSRNGSGSSVSAEDSGSATHGGEANGP